MVQCSDCGAGYYEGRPHKCLVFVPFERWDAELQKDAALDYTGPDRLLRACDLATKNVARWPEWKRRLMWQEKFQFSVREKGSE